MYRYDFISSSARRAGLSVAVLFLFASAVSAATVEVKVSDPDGKTLAGASVALVPSNRQITTGDDGIARFEGVAAGSYDVAVRRSGFAPSRSDVTVAESSPISVPVTLVTQAHFTESVTVSPGGRDTFESYQPASVLGGEDLQQRLGNTLGATLANEPGVNVRTFGSGNARPVVRGLDNDRVLILENGARTGDLSSQSADHGVTLDPATATQIEVVRGPATLLYGSSAIGGVVNLISDEIATKPVDSVHGAFTVQGATADQNAGIAGNVSGGNGKFAYRVNGSAQRSDEYDTPDGKVPNSQSNSKSGGGSLASTGENGYLGASYQYVDTRYGVPFVEEGGTTLHPRRQRVDLRGEKRNLRRVHRGDQVPGRLQRLQARRDREVRRDRDQLQEPDFRGQPVPGPKGLRGAHRHLRHACRASRLQRGRRGSAGSAHGTEELVGLLL